MTAYSQPGDKKADSLKPAREVILKNPGEKDLPQKLKEDQLKQAPVMLSDFFDQFEGDKTIKGKLQEETKQKEQLTIN